jgi:hypothetical protein
MSKQLKARTGSYTKDGQTKGRYVTIGAILSNENGEYALIDPSVSLAGVLAQQNSMAAADGKPTRSNIMCSIFDNDNQGQQQGGGAYKQHGSSQGGEAPSQPAPATDFDDSDDIPF